MPSASAGVACRTTTESLRSSILESRVKVIPHEAMHQRLARAPLPSAAASDRDVGVRIEVELRETHAALAIIAILQVTVPKMKYRPRGVAQIGAHCIVEGPRPCKKVLAAASIEEQIIDEVLEIPRNTSGDRPIATADDARVIEA